MRCGAPAWGLLSVSGRNIWDLAELAPPAQKDAGPTPAPDPSTRHTPSSKTNRAEPNRPSGDTLDNTSQGWGTGDGGAGGCP